jgi:hypothetical protein
MAIPLRAYSVRHSWPGTARNISSPVQNIEWFQARNSYERPLNMRLWLWWNECAASSHQSLILSKSAGSTCCQITKFSQVDTCNQTICAKGQRRQRWWPVSGGPLHNGQLVGCSQPLMVRLSAVSCLFWIRIQANNLHLFSVWARCPLNEFCVIPLDHPKELCTVSWMGGVDAIHRPFWNDVHIGSPKFALSVALILCSNVNYWIHNTPCTVIFILLFFIPFGNQTSIL